MFNGNENIDMFGLGGIDLLCCCCRASAGLASANAYTDMLLLYSITYMNYP